LLQTTFTAGVIGLQAARVVVDAIHQYMSETYVQLGAGYDLSTRASLTVETAHDVVQVSIDPLFILLPWFC
jgi:hypothetical protein